MAVPERPGGLRGLCAWAVTEAPGTVRAVHTQPPHGPGHSLEGTHLQDVPALPGTGCPPHQALGGPGTGTVLPDAALHMWLHAGLGAAAAGLVAGGQPSPPSQCGAAGGSVPSRLRKKHPTSPRVRICGSAVPVSRASRCWCLQCLRSWASPSFPGRPSVRLGSSQVLLRAKSGCMGKACSPQLPGQGSCTHPCFSEQLRARLLLQKLELDASGRWKEIPTEQQGRAAPPVAAGMSASVQTGPSSVQGQGHRSGAATGETAAHVTVATGGAVPGCSGPQAPGELN